MIPPVRRTPPGGAGSSGRGARVPRRRASSALLLAALILLSLARPPAAGARYRFVEGDWIAWGDARTPHDFDVGRQVIYIATDAGILRWERDENRWLFPWYSVPTSPDGGLLLEECRQVREDPLTRDVYVRTARGWVVRDIATLRWREVQPPEGMLAERLHLGRTPGLIPDRGLLMPDSYFLSPEGKLQYRYVNWPSAGGVSDDRGTLVYGWKGFGVGIADAYSKRLELYPAGPGPATALDVNGGEIWCASVLDHEEGWVWRRDRSENRWRFYHPVLEWGLEPARVNRLRVAGKIAWMATSEGVMVLQGSSWRRFAKKEGLPRREIFDIAPYGDGAWAASEFGLAYIDLSRGVILHPDKELYPEPRSAAFTQLAMDGDTLWAVGPGRLWRLDPTGTWREEAMPSTTALASRPTALLAAGGLLALGDTQGFAWRDSTGTWRQVYNDLWGGSGAVFAIARHGGYFWLGTSRGLVKYDPVEGDALPYREQDGLAGSMVFEIFPEGDWLWLGTDRALVRFRWTVEGRID